MAKHEAKTDWKKHRIGQDGRKSTWKKRSKMKTNRLKHAWKKLAEDCRGKYDVKVEIYERPSRHDRYRGSGRLFTIWD